MNLLVCALLLTLHQPGPQIDPPLVGRPDGFSNIVGKYQIEVSAEPTEVRVEEPITLTIRIIGSGPAKYEPDRKHLDLFPAWNDDFYVQEMRDEHKIERDKKTWLFVYRLKPKHAKVDAIDGIKLVYYDPSIPRKNKFVTVPAEPIKIIVKPKPENLDVVAPPAVPESFFERASSAEVLARSPSPIEVTGEVIATVVFYAPFACFVALLAIFWPGKVRFWNRQLSESAERAVADLRGGTESPWTIVCRYLRQRLDFAAQDAAPREVARFLKRRGFALDRCAQTEMFLKACDAVRFTGMAVDDPKPMAEDAIKLIQALEADPCVR